MPCIVNATARLALASLFALLQQLEILKSADTVQFARWRNNRARIKALGSSLDSFEPITNCNDPRTKGIRLGKQKLSLAGNTEHGFEERGRKAQKPNANSEVGAPSTEDDITVIEGKRGERDAAHRCTKRPPRWLMV
ncbi:hypothetical protein BS47DRAFT_1365829 [Hydnum rufescens UP504]|uniref:Uncharacterized protein n=1 Tax=Hydnum rufescens UP504 TaxID=1448309 RepID=A0A9P6AMT3_9AGAM|nr:hypothetical protein BS47DRAFT_1365829 [Hydnum rufescens UP504]